MFLLMFLEINNYNYTRLPMIWWIWCGKLGTYIKDKRVVDLVHSRNSRFLKIRNKGLTKSIFRSV